MNSGRMIFAQMIDYLPIYEFRQSVKGIQENKNLVFLTNNFTLPALTITEIYRKRWQIELFFKWIKQTSANQGVLWNIRECGQNTNMDYYLLLRS